MAAKVPLSSRLTVTFILFFDRNIRNQVLLLSCLIVHKMIFLNHTVDVRMAKPDVLSSLTSLQAFDTFWGCYHLLTGNAFNLTIVMKVVMFGYVIEVWCTECLRRIAVYLEHSLIRVASVAFCTMFSSISKYSKNCHHTGGFFLAPA